MSSFESLRDNVAYYSFVVELSFENKVYPTTIQIYETYHPGCVVKILAADTSNNPGGYIR